MVFKPLDGPARYIGAYGGRGSGKSHYFAEKTIVKCISRRETRVVCVREIQRTLKESVKILIEDKIRSLGVSDLFDVQSDRIVTPGDGVILFHGLQDHTAESIKSLEGMDVAYAEESQTLTTRSLEILRPTIRKPNSELWFSWNPRNPEDPIDALLRGPNIPPDARVVCANWADNPFFPPVLEQERLYDLAHHRDRYGHVWEGEYEPTVIGAIWTRQVIQHWRRQEAPALQRVLIGVDPAVSSEPGSNETGIVAAGHGADGRGYVLDDVSMHGQPHQWAERAIALYDAWEADAIVVEVNQGGELVRDTLRTRRPGLPVIQVRATRGKHVRAEPIAALYALGRISHVGTFPELENQMLRMTAAGYEGLGSPDRLDAMIWALSELFSRISGGIRTTDAPRPPENTIVHWMM